MDDSVAMRNLIVYGSGLREWRDQLIPRATPLASPVTEHGGLTCLNVQFRVFNSVASFHGGVITALALSLLDVAQGMDVRADKKFGPHAGELGTGDGVQ
jgi:hypothetical protein